MPSRAIPLQLSILAVLTVLPACNKVEVSCSHIHPDIEKPISLTGKVIDDNILPVDIAIMVNAEVQSQTTAESRIDKTVYPILEPNVHSNEKLLFSTVATNPGGNSYDDEDWVFIANPLGFPPNPVSPGPSPRFPTKRREETGARLFHSAENIIYEHAIDAVKAYRDTLERYEIEVTCEDILANTDYLVEAVAEYVSNYYARREDHTQTTYNNYNVYDLLQPEDYQPYLTSNFLGREKDFAQPANLTLLVGSELPNGVYPSSSDHYDPSRFIIGDCEDWAIVRAALLRQLGLAPWAIWCTTDLWAYHEYNIVIYQGAYRIMDSAPISNWLKSYPQETFWGWNERYGPRGWGLLRLGAHFRLIHRVNNYPGGKGDGHIWCWTVYTTSVSP